METKKDAMLVITLDDLNRLDVILQSLAFASHHYAIHNKIEEFFLKIKERNS